MNDQRFISKLPINKGWSGDQKYSVTDENGCRYLLRISPIEQYDRKIAEFCYMEQVAKLGIPMCMPIEFGKCEEGVYSLQSWIVGVDAEEVIQTLTEEQAYTYGREAGQILKKIHTLPTRCPLSRGQFHLERQRLLQCELKRRKYWIGMMN